MTDDAQRTLLLRRRREKAGQRAGSDVGHGSDGSADPALDDLVAQLTTLKQQLHERETIITELRQTPAEDTERYGTVHAGLPVFKLRDLFASATDVKMLGQGKQATVYRLRFPTEETCVLRVYDFKFAEHLPGEHIERYDQIMDFFSTEQSIPQELQDHQVVLPLLSSFFVEAEGGVFQPANAYQDIPGQTIAALQAASPLSELDVLDIIEQTAYSLSKAHTAGEKGILHRDVKEENLLRREQDMGITLLDCGIAREAEVSSLTGTIGVGTRGYMAPEQEIGNPVPASDIYSLGVMAKKLLHGVVHDRTLQKLLDDMATYDVEDRVQRFGLSGIKTDEIASAVVERIQRYRNILNGHAAETLAERTGETITGWDVPSIEATVYAREVIQSQSLNTLKKIARLERYLATEPVRERDQSILNQAIKLLKEDVAPAEIEATLRKANSQRPEFIFGFTRGELYSLWHYARNIPLGYQEPRSEDLLPAHDTAFRSFVEAMSSLGVSFDALGSVLSHVHAYSREYDYGGSPFDHTLYKSLLGQIKHGEMDDAVADVQQRYQGTLDEKVLSDPRHLAVVMTMEREGLVVGSKDIHEDRCVIGETFEGDVSAYFGKTSGPARFAGITTGAASGLALYGALFFTVAEPVASFVRWLPDALQEPVGLCAALVTFVGVCAAPIFGGLGGYAAADVASLYATRKQFTGSIKRRYAVSDVLDATAQLFKELPPETYATNTLTTTLTQVGEATQHTLTPYELIDNVKGLLQSPKKEPGDPHA